MTTLYEIYSYVHKKEYFIPVTLFDDGVYEIGSDILVIDDLNDHSFEVHMSWFKKWEDLKVMASILQYYLKTADIPYVDVRDVKVYKLFCEELNKTKTKPDWEKLQILLNK